jgi:hypothetical protein
VLEDRGEQIGAAQLGHLDVGDHEIEVLADQLRERGWRRGLAGHVVSRL